jgi:hypothetical protein
MPPSYMLVRRVDRLLALELQALEDKVSLLVTFEANFLLCVPLKFMRGQSSRNGI